jgi:hypothetical protein
MSDSLSAALGTLLALEPTDDEVRRVLELDDARRSRRRRLTRIGLAAVVVAGAVSAAPPTRAALDDVYESLAVWGDDSPGRALAPSDNVPGWLRAEPGEHRVLAEAGGVALVASRDGDRFEVTLGSSFGEGGSLDDWREFFGAHAVVLLGPANAAPNQPFDAKGRQPLFGLAAKSVTRVELTYKFGPPTSDENVDGGFGFLADATRPLRALVAYDRNGRQVERRDLHGMDLRVCFDVRGCPPGRRKPDRAKR